MNRRWLPLACLALWLGSARHSSGTATADLPGALRSWVGLEHLHRLPPPPVPTADGEPPPDLALVEARIRRESDCVSTLEPDLDGDVTALARGNRAALEALAELAGPAPRVRVVELIGSPDQAEELVRTEWSQRAPVTLADAPGPRVPELVVSAPQGRIVLGRALQPSFEDLAARLSSQVLPSPFVVVTGLGRLHPRARHDVGVWVAGAACRGDPRRWVVASPAPVVPDDACPSVHRVELTPALPLGPTELPRTLGGDPLAVQAIREDPTLCGFLRAAEGAQALVAALGSVAPRRAPPEMRVRAAVDAWLERDPIRGLTLLRGAGRASDYVGMLAAAAAHYAARTDEAGWFQVPVSAGLYRSARALPGVRDPAFDARRPVADVRAVLRGCSLVEEEPGGRAFRFRAGLLQRELALRSERALYAVRVAP